MDTNPSHDKSNVIARAPRVEACIQDAMEKYAGGSPGRDLTYYQNVHQDLAPLARELENALSIANARIAELERATPPSPSAAPEVDERAAAFEEAARIAASFGPGRPLVERRPNDLIRGRWEGEQAASANIARMLLERAALASRPAEVDSSPKPPRTPEEMVAFIGSHFDAMRDETSDPEDIRFTLSVHDLLSAMSDWFEDYAESAHSNEKAAEVDDEGLPVLPESKFCSWVQHGRVWNAFPYGVGDKARWDRGGYWTAKGFDREPLFTAEQYRQGQRDAVAVDRARREKGGM